MRGDPQQGTTKGEAQARVDEIRAFRAELGRLRSEGVLVLSEQQAGDIDAHHARLATQLQATFDVDADPRSRQLSLGMRVASFLGALSLAASVFFFFYRYWGRLDTPWQIAILVSAPLATYVLALWLRVRESSGTFARLAALVALVCFVLDLSMLGQIFNITPSDHALVVWSALALLLAYAVESRLLLAAGIACVLAFAAARIGTWGGVYWMDFGERPENLLLPSAAIAAVPWLWPQLRWDGFATTYRVLGLIALYGTLLLLGHWGEASYLLFEAKSVEHGYQVAGLLVAAAGIAWGVRQDLPEVLNTSVSFFVVLLFTKFYDWWWDVLPKYLFFLVVGLTAVLILVMLRRLRHGGGRQPMSEVPQ